MPHAHVNGTGAPSKASAAEEIKKLVDANAKLSQELDAIRSMVSSRAESEEADVIKRADIRISRISRLDDARIGREREWARALNILLSEKIDEAASLGELSVGIALIEAEREVHKLFVDCDARMIARRIEASR